MSTIPTIVQRLRTEHEFLKGLFTEVEAILASVHSAGEVRAMARLIEQLLTSHARLEEDLLFVPLEHCLEDEGSLLVLFRDHQEIDARLRQLQSVDQLMDARMLLRSALFFSRRHFDQEESLLFPLAGRLMGEEMLTRLNQGT